jgi:hypothetical protein
MTGGMIPMQTANTQDHSFIAPATSGISVTPSSGLERIEGVTTLNWHDGLVEDSRKMFEANMASNIGKCILILNLTSSPMTPQQADEAITDLIDRMYPPSRSDCALPRHNRDGNARNLITPTTSQSAQLGHYKRSWD